MAELLIGCGNQRKKMIAIEGMNHNWTDLTTLDIDPSCKPNVVHDLNELPLPFADDSFDEIHAYEVLEHVGVQGDWKFFFDQFYEFWRILKPDGLFVGTCPMWDSKWAWGDPGHTRIINDGTLVFLNQQEYIAQVGNTAMTDYREYWDGDFDLMGKQEDGDTFGFVLKAIK